VLGAQGEVNMLDNESAKESGGGKAILCHCCVIKS